MGAGNDNLLGARILEHAYGAGDGATGVNHVVEKHAVLALYIADHAVGHRLIGFSVGAGLVHEG